MAKADDVALAETRMLEAAKDNKCPYCLSRSTKYTDTVFDLGTCALEAECEECKKKWWEEYDLKRVVEFNP